MQQQNLPLVSVKWLAEQQGKSNLVIVEAKMKPVKAADDWESGFKFRMPS